MSKSFIEVMQETRNLSLTADEKSAIREKVAFSMRAEPAPSRLSKSLSWISHYIQQLVYFFGRKRKA